METDKDIKMIDHDYVEWYGLVNRGRVLRSKRESGAIVDIDKSGPPVKGKIDRDKNVKTPKAVRQWILARHRGMSVNKASSLTGCTWGEVRLTYLTSEECRCAMDALHEDSRHLMKELAYSSMEDALKGEEVTKHQYKAADKILSSLESEHFGRPADRAGLVTADGQVIGGGITINLIDVSKGYRPPIAAQIGDGDEGVLV